MAITRALARSVGLSALVLLPGVLISQGSRPAGALWMLVGSFLLMSSSYRKPWRLGLVSCLLPPVGAALSYVVQLAIFETVPPAPLLLGAAAAGAVVGWWRGSAHRVYVNEGQVFAQRTVAFLGAWFVAYAATQLFGFARAGDLLALGLTGGAFTTVMLLAAGFVLVGKRQIALSAPPVAVAILAVPLLMAALSPLWTSFAAAQVPNAVRDILTDDLAPSGYRGGSIVRRDGASTTWRRQYDGPAGAMVITLQASTPAQIEGFLRIQFSNRSSLAMSTGGLRPIAAGRWAFVHVLLPSGIQQRLGNTAPGGLEGWAHYRDWGVSLTWAPPLPDQDWRVTSQRAQNILERIHGRLQNAPSATVTAIIPSFDRGGGGGGSTSRLEEAAFLASVAGSIIMILVSMGVNLANAATIASVMVGQGSSGGASPPRLAPLIDPYSGEPLPVDAGGRYWDAANSRWVSRAEAETMVAELQVEHRDYLADRAAARARHDDQVEIDWADLRHRNSVERLIHSGALDSRNAPPWLRERFPDLWDQIQEPGRADEFSARAEATRRWMEERYPDQLDALDELIDAAMRDGSVTEEELSLMRRMSREIWAGTQGARVQDAQGWLDIANSQQVLEDITWEVLKAGGTAVTGGARGGALVIGGFVGFWQHWRDNNTVTDAMGAAAVKAVFNQLGHTVGNQSESILWQAGTGAVTTSAESAWDAGWQSNWNSDRMAEAARRGAGIGFVAGGIGGMVSRGVSGMRGADWEPNLTITRGADDVRISVTRTPVAPDVPRVRGPLGDDVEWSPAGRGARTEPGTSHWPGDPEDVRILPDDPVSAPPTHGPGAPDDLPRVDPDGPADPLADDLGSVEPGETPDFEEPDGGFRSGPADGDDVGSVADDAAGIGEGGPAAGQTAPDHADEGGWSPEALSRMEHNDFYEWRGGRLVPITDPAVIDVTPGHRRVIVQVNRHTGTTDMRWDPNLTANDRTAMRAQIDRALDDMPPPSPDLVVEGGAGGAAAQPPQDPPPTLEGIERGADGRWVIPSDESAPAAGGVGGGRAAGSGASGGGDGGAMPQGGEELSSSGGDGGAPTGGDGPPGGGVGGGDGSGGAGSTTTIDLDPDQPGITAHARMALAPDGHGFVYMNGVQIGYFDADGILRDMNHRPIRSVVQSDWSHEIESYVDADGNGVKFIGAEPGTRAARGPASFDADGEVIEGSGARVQVDGRWRRPEEVGMDFMNEPLRVVYPPNAPPVWRATGANAFGEVVGRDGQVFARIDMDGNINLVGGGRATKIGMARDGRVAWYVDESGRTVWTGSDGPTPVDAARTRVGTTAEPEDLPQIRQQTREQAAEVDALREPDQAQTVDGGTYEQDIDPVDTRGPDD